MAVAYYSNGMTPGNVHPDSICIDENCIYLFCIFFLQRPPSSSLSYSGPGNDDTRSPGSVGGTPGPLSAAPPLSQQSVDNVSEAGRQQFFFTPEKNGQPSFPFSLFAAVLLLHSIIPPTMVPPHSLFDAIALVERNNRLSCLRSIR